MMLVEAKVVDSTHLELARPIVGRRGRTVMVSVADSAEQDAERRRWLTASASSLQGAYSDSEPDYSPSLIRETNPEYGA